MLLLRPSTSTLYYFLLVRRFRDVFRSEELWAYVIIAAVAVGAITVDIVDLYGSVSTSLRHAFFQVSSIMTTTGYATVDSIRALLLQGDPGGADVHWRLRRLHRRRTEGGPGGEPGEGVRGRDAADAPPQCGTYHPL